MIDLFPTRIDHRSAWKASVFRDGVDDVAFGVQGRHHDGLRETVRRAPVTG